MGHDTNTAHFSIMMGPAHHLDGDYTIFGGCGGAPLAAAPALPGAWCQLRGSRVVEGGLLWGGRLTGCCLAPLAPALADSKMRMRANLRLPPQVAASC